VVVVKLSGKINLFGKTAYLSLGTVPTPKERTGGKSSRILNTIYHILPLDYDKIDQQSLEIELLALIDEFELGNMHIFKMPDRENAFHVVCLDYFLLHEVKAITMSSSCDIAFVLAPRYDKFKNWVLRDFPKGDRQMPVFLKTVISPYEGKRKQSQAHATYLNAMYGCNIELSNSDGNTALLVESYLTANRTERKNVGERDDQK
jgi:hypothetical protein